MSVVSPLTRLRRRDTFLLFGAIVLVAAVAVYHEIIVTNSWIRNTGRKAYSVGDIWKKALSDNWVRRAQQNYVEDSSASSYSYTPQPWKQKYKGRANLHAFEDWCGKSIAELRKNPHYPLYPHSRSTVLKLAVIPKWTNYGLRIFGYLHPYTDGEFVFALSSQDNSELWLSTDDSPLNLQLLGWVGKTGTEWTAPGEFEKYISQLSRPVRLSAERKYFFELLHKQDHEGTDHVEVAWQLQGEGSRFTVIESQHISLYVDESAMVAGDVEHVPQTAASNYNTKQSSSTVDMLREDPRDILYQVPLINRKFLQDVLPDCEYKPSYTIKGVPLARYQGLNYVKLSYIHPNDHTRLTHMESEKSCVYPPDIMEKLGFSGYMKLDSPDLQEQKTTDRNQSFLWKGLAISGKEKEISPDTLFRDYGADNETLTEKFRQILQSLPLQKDNTKPHPQAKSGKPKLTQIVSKERRIVKRSLKLLQVKNVNPGMNWRQTFQINHLDYRAHNSDAMEVKCKIAGSLLINSNDVLPVVKDFMDKLNKKHNWRFMLVQVVNVVKRVDPAKGSCYLLELLLKDMNGQMLRLSQYVYATTPQPELVLCNPVAFSWNPLATVHIIVPVKNQARWVHKLIIEMENVFRESGDTNFNLIVIDYDSTDMDMEKALKNSSLHRYQYLKLSGNFQRSGGLQAGVDLIKDQHSIVFLCDLHLQFPTAIIDSIRKHTVEGHMAFAPIIMRLDCGATPLEARGFWEVEGFGLLGIYKSDLDAVGGMNTKEYTDRWGGEDWELLDRILNSGLEVDRVYLRNFFHYFHSKRGMWQISTKK
ncbi:beta-1,4-N-acetylgalactosaminyltransferase 3 isoform X2 [Hippoglossus stenolepis]|uniref:beta-1,4-N-acetylgalactosaminyltransferase 3 isoform X2 n=1 Tax=Hippoglossus stenolepis TaxID=195615 RepID=UPI001FB0100D|nr:beta-1,4-N-acetylgalactosaminyltransferase 3 isoform X2 [Hippoglossus stenolepis]